MSDTGYGQASADTLPRPEGPDHSGIVTRFCIPKTAWIGLPLLGIVGVGMWSLASVREIGGYGVETDFYGVFVPDALRLLAGEALEVEWHPPFYSILLSAVYMLSGDWFQSGLIISVCAAVIALAAAYWLFGNLFGSSFGIAAALSLMIWPDFLLHAVTASTDMMFLGLMLLSLAIGSASSQSVAVRGAVVGIVGGLASLTRTNGFVLLLLPLFYASHYSRERRLRAAFSVACGFLLPWSIWILTSAVTDSPVYPSRNYIAIAVTFFGPESHRDSGNSDNWVYAESAFSSLRDVLTHDPVTLARGTARNFLHHGWQLFQGAPALLVIAAVAAGSFIYLLAARGLPALWVLFLILSVQYGVLCLRTFESRYFLFLIPAVGAGVYGAIEIVSRQFVLFNRARRAVAVLSCLILSLAMGPVTAGQLSRLRDEGRDSLDAAALITQMHLTGRVVARKPHLGFHAGLERWSFPPLDTLDELRTQLCSRSAEGRTLVFFGAAEAAFRPQLNILQSPESPPDWLLPIGHGQSGPSKWTLHELRCAT